MPHSPQASRPSEPVIALWLAALLPALVLGGLVSGGAFLVGRDEGLSSLLGVGLALTALCLTTVLHWQIRMSDPFMGMALALTTYGLVIALLWAAYLSLGEVTWLVGPATAFGLLAGTLGWAGGHMRGALKLRQTVYDDRDTHR